jgi:hypothetical protein
MSRTLKIAIIFFALACLIAGLARIARCQETPQPLAMKAHNLRAAEEVLAKAGHEVKALDGTTVADNKQRQEGTGLIFLRGCNLQGEWFCYALEAEEGSITRIKLYPIKSPLESGNK